MCHDNPCEGFPQTTVRFSVIYCHKEQRWHAHYCATSITDEGDILERGGLTKDFGPFDDVRDVAQWMHVETWKQLKPVSKYFVVRQDPPQGRTQPRS